MQTLARWWTWGLGELPEARTPPADATLWWIVAFTGLAMGLGDLYGIGGEPITKGMWRMAAHGGPCLAAVAAVSPGPLVARVVAGALAVLPVAWRILDAASLKAHPAGCAALLLAAAIATRVAVGSRAWADAGLGLGDTRWWLRRMALAVTLVVVGVSVAVLLSPGMQAYYPSWKPARTDPFELGRQLLGVSCDFVGWELMFRGVLLHLLARRGDPRLAIAAQAIPFFLLHADKPALEYWSSLPGGVIAGWFCLRARSFVPLWLLHTVMYTTAATTAFLLR